MPDQDLVRMPNQRLNRHRNLLIHLVIAATPAILCSAFAAPGAEAFANLRRLTGEWEAKTARGSIIRVVYKLVAADSALVETFRTAPGRETLTIYHADGSDLIATHYCAQGNQPRLRLQSVGANRILEFAYYDATNLAGSTASHLTRLRFEFKDPDRFEKTEVYAADGKEDVTVLSFVRVAPPGDPKKD
jgi:hypothetical protein